MTEEESPELRYARLEYDLFYYQCGIDEETRIRNLRNIPADKERFLSEMHNPVDPELRSKVGTPEFFAEALDIVWDAFRGGVK